MSRGPQGLSRRRPAPGSYHTADRTPQPSTATRQPGTSSRKWDGRYTDRSLRQLAQSTGGRSPFDNTGPERSAAVICTTNSMKALRRAGPGRSNPETTGEAHPHRGPARGSKCYHRDHQSRDPGGNGGSVFHPVEDRKLCSLRASTGIPVSGDRCHLTPQSDSPTVTPRSMLLPSSQSAPTEEIAAPSARTRSGGC